MTARQVTLTAGQRVGEWKLIEYRKGEWVREEGRYRQTRKPMWKCQCSCGVIRWVRSQNLVAGGTSSCGHEMPALVVRHKRCDLRPVNSVFALGDAE